MPALLRHLAGLIWPIAFWGCSAPVRQLHPISGDDFTLFPGERRAPPPITCTGDTRERFACFAKELEERSARLDAAGALAVSTPEGEIRTIVRRDALNEELELDDGTRFPVASVTKMFVAAATVSLSLDGSLDLQAPIARYLPELPRAGGVGRASLHQLLTHTSGLGSPPQCETKETDLPEVLERYGRAPLLSPPGAVYNYSNLGYSFVALVLERVERKPFEQVVRERVLLPAGMPEATFGPDRVKVRGHGPEGLTVMPRCRAMWPAGGLVLSLRELAAWGRALSRPASFALGQPLLQLLTTQHVETTDRPGGGYGYGVKRFEHGGVTFLSHAGRLEDFSAFVAWAPERGVSVAGVANRSELFIVAAGWRAMSTFLSVPEDWQPPGPAHQLAAYTGTYVDAAGSLGRLRVSLEDDALVIDYLDGAPALLPANFSFAFEPGAAQARYVVTPVGVGERRSE